MKALLIEPECRTISVIWYDSVMNVDFTKVIEKLLGGPYQWEFEFRNGDGLFTGLHSVSDRSNYAYFLKSVSCAFFGKSLIARLPPPTYMRLHNCSFCLPQIINDVFFYSKRCTAVVRNAYL